MYIMWHIRLGLSFVHLTFPYMQLQALVVVEPEVVRHVKDNMYKVDGRRVRPHPRLSPFRHRAGIVGMGHRGLSELVVMV